MFNLRNHQRLVFVSAEQAGQSAAANANATDELRSKLARYLDHGVIDSVIACDGQYLGTPERSFMVICDSDVVHTLELAAKQFNQECILVAHNNHGHIDGVLHYASGDVTRIGTLQLCVPGQQYDASTSFAGLAFTFA